MITQSGELVINAHVVQNCKSIEVELGKQTLPAQIVASDNHNDYRYYQINAAVEAGNGDDPLLNEQGHVLRIVSMKLNASKVETALGDLPQNVNFAIKSSQLVGFLDANQIDDIGVAGKQRVERDTVIHELPFKKPALFNVERQCMHRQKKSENKRGN